MVTAQIYLEENNYRTPQEYFEEGGSLEALNQRVQYLIQMRSLDAEHLDNFSWKYDKDRVISQLTSAISYVKKNTIPLSLWRKVFGPPDDKLCLPLAEALLRRLQTPNFCSWSPEVIFSKERTFEEVVFDVASKAILQTKMKEDRVFRNTIRQHLYYRVKLEWERQAQTVSGYAKWFFDQVAAVSGSAPALDIGLACLKKIDELEEGIGQPDNERCLILDHMAWLSDVHLLRYVQTNQEAEYLHLKGSFQLTEKGIEIAKKALPLCRAIYMPGGTVWENKGKGYKKLPEAFQDNWESVMNEYVVVDNQ